MCIRDSPKESDHGSDKCKEYEDSGSSPQRGSQEDYDGIGSSLQRGSQEDYDGSGSSLQRRGQEEYVSRAEESRRQDGGLVGGSDQVRRGRPVGRPRRGA